MRVLITAQFNSAMQRLSKSAQREVITLYAHASAISRDELTSSPWLTKLESGSGDIYTLRTRGVRVFCSFGAQDDLLFLEVEEVKEFPLESSLSQHTEITLFSPSGVPVAYVAANEENTIYSFDGRPLAYVDKGNNIYGFNGQHLGWFEEGTVWDHEGRRVGFTSGQCPALTRLEPFKAFKRFKPFKAFKSRAPRKPFKSFQNSEMDLLRFLELGAQ